MRFYIMFRTVCTQSLHMTRDIIAFRMKNVVQNWNFQAQHLASSLTAHNKIQRNVHSVFF